MGAQVLPVILTQKQHASWEAYFPATASTKGQEEFLSLTQGNRAGTQRHVLMQRSEERVRSMLLLSSPTPQIQSPEGYQQTTLNVI